MQTQSLFKKADFYIVLMMYAFCGVIIWQMINTTIEDSRLMPGMVLCITAVSATGLLISTIRNKKVVAEIGSLMLTRQEILACLLLVVVYQAISLLGFFSAAFILSTGISFLIWPLKSVKSVIGLLIYNIVLTCTLYVVFIHLFSMSMPSGILI